MAAQQQKLSAAAATALPDESKDDEDINIYEDGGRSNKQLEQSSDQVSAQFAVFNISSRGDETSQKMSVGPASSSNCHRTRTSKVSSVPLSLEVLNNVADIDLHYDGALHQIETLSQLEQKWQEITKNFNEVIRHLNDSSAEVSSQCLLHQVTYYS